MRKFLGIKTIQPTAEIDINRWKKLAGLQENADPAGDPAGASTQQIASGSDIHVLNDNNAVIEKKPVNGHPYNYLKLNLQIELSEKDIDQLIKELQVFKDKLNQLNTPAT